MGCWGQLLQTLIPFPLFASRSHLKAHTVATKFSVGNRFQKKERKEEEQVLGAWESAKHVFQFYLNTILHEYVLEKDKLARTIFLFISSSFK